MGLFKKVAKAVLKKGVEKAMGTKINEQGYPEEDKEGRRFVKTNEIHLSGVTFKKRGKDPQRYIPELKMGNYLEIINEPVDGHPEALLVTYKNKPLGWIPSDYQNKKKLYDVVTNDITYYARPKKILGGTKRKPTYGLVIEVAYYE